MRRLSTTLLRYLTTPIALAALLTPDAARAQGLDAQREATLRAFGGAPVETPDRTPPHASPAHGWGGVALKRLAASPGEALPAPSLGEAVAKSRHGVQVSSKVCGGYTLITTAFADRRRWQGHAVNLSTGERVGPASSPLIDAPICMSAPSGSGRLIVTGSNDGPPQRFDTASGRWGQISLELPDGAKLSHSAALPILDEKHQPRAVLISAVSVNRKRYHGVWQPNQRTVQLKQQPFGLITQARFVGAKVQLVAYISPAERARVRGDGYALYTIDGEGVRRAMTGREIWLLDGGWTLISKGKTSVALGPDGATQTLQNEACDPSGWNLYAAHAPTQSALFLCPDAKDPQLDRMALWSPAGTRAWTQRRTTPKPWRTWIAQAPKQPQDRPIIAELPATPHNAREVAKDRELFKKTQTTRHQWYDLRQGKRWHSTAPLPVPALRRQHPTLVLATDKGEHEGADRAQPHALWLLDFDAGTERLLHTYKDCPGFLNVQAQRDDLAILTCIRRPEVGNFNAYLIWSEVLDLSSGRRWRAPRGQHPMVVLDDRRLIIGNMTPGANVIYGRPSTIWISASIPAQRP